ncbi:hypothetical protein ACWD4V_26330 [Streptomyces tsukubensis]|uniref:hypothetical protein n=1 Tax=Streptomyces tsukubensis TaxID=83656 RepID=UPI0036B6334C
MAFSSVGFEYSAFVVAGSPERDGARATSSPGVAGRSLVGRCSDPAAVARRHSVAPAAWAEPVGPYPSPP